MVRCDVPCEATGDLRTSAGTLSASTGRTATRTIAPSLLSSTVVIHGLYPEALATMTCVPGSTGTADPQTAGATTWPSCCTSRSPGAGAGTSMTSRGSFGSSMATRALAMASRGSARAAAISMASLKSVQAVVMSPTFSLQSAKCKSVPSCGSSLWLSAYLTQASRKLPVALLFCASSKSCVAVALSALEGAAVEESGDKSSADVIIDTQRLTSVPPGRASRRASVPRQPG